MTLEEFLDAISSFSARGKSFKPHKHILLLAIIRLVREGIVSTSSVYFSAELRKAFSEEFDKHATKDDRNRPAAPFFHLASHGFWKLVPTAGQEDELSNASTVGSPGELMRLVDHAAIDDTVLTHLRDPATCERILRELEALILEGIESRTAPSAVREERAQYSLFAHEANALSLITRHIQRHGIGVPLCNLELHDRQSNRYFETDLVLVSRFGVDAAVG